MFLTRGELGAEKLGELKILAKCIFGTWNFYLLHHHDEQTRHILTCCNADHSNNFMPTRSPCGL